MWIRLECRTELSDCGGSEIGERDMAEKILLVDDEPNVLDGFRRTLGREFTLETAVGGQEALCADG